MALLISQDCAGCGVCRKKCPWDAIIGERKQTHIIEPTLCRECCTCWYMCPRCAVEDIEGYRRTKGKPRMPRAFIDPDGCAGCQNCMLNCEQRAISFHKSLLGGTCRVDASLCKSCGTCMTYCVNECISMK